MPPEIARLRGLVDDLDKYDLPDQFRGRSSFGANGRNHGDDEDEANGPAVPPALVSRYKRARESYVRRQTMQRLVECLAAYDPATNTLPLPSPADSGSLAEAARRRDEVLSLVRSTVGSVNSEADAVRAKFGQFADKRDELKGIVDGMERAQRRAALGEGRDDDEEDDGGEEESDGEEVTEEDLAHEKERLAEVRRRKAELKERIRSVRSQIVDAEDDIATRKRAVDEVRARSGRGPLDWSGMGRGGTQDSDGSDGSNNTDAAGGLDAVAEAVRSEAAEASDRAAELRRSAEFYDGMRELMEELGGVKILSSRTTGGGDDGGFVLSLMLLGQHVLEVALAREPLPPGKADGTKRDLRVESARLTTAATFTVPSPPAGGGDGSGEDTAQLAETMHSVSLTNQSLARIMAQRPSVSITVPPLDDLVRWSRTLDDSSRGIRFVLVETLGRIRALDARVSELNLLRVRYAAQVYDIDGPGGKSSSSGGGSPDEFGAAEQEVVCAVNEGITVALRLGPDCPLVPGSVYVSEMYGVGGWSDERLDVLRDAVRERRCRGPVEVMEVLVGEIRRRSREEGWAVPPTPMLPRGRG